MNSENKKHKEIALFIYNMNEIEVFRLKPEVGKYYETAVYTRKTGSWSNADERYYTTNPLLYVGKFVKTIQYGYGDNVTSTGIFDNNGVEQCIDYTTDGTTCFIEVKIPPPPPPPTTTPTQT